MTKTQTESITARQPVGHRLVAIVLLFVLTVAAIIFRSFIFGDRVLLYKDIGSDSINDSYPYFVHLSDYLRGQGLPSWSFCVGLGQSLFYRAGDLIWEPVIWLPRQLIAQALIFQFLLKTLIAGALFFRFLQLRGLNVLSSSLGVFLLCFSAYNLAGSCWYVNADEVVCFSLLLLTAEAALSHGRWLWLSLAAAVAGLISVFHIYLAAVLLSVYVPLRFIELHGWNPRVMTRVCAQLATVALIGVGLSSVITLGSAYCLLNSARGSGAVPKFGWIETVPFFHFDSPLYYVTVALRSFSNDLLGTGDDYRGWQNYLEASTTYCGLVVLLILPQIFVRATFRERILYSLFFSLIIIPVAFPAFRSAFWLFQGGYFRTFSLFSVLGFVTLGATAFQRYAQDDVLNLPLLFATLIVLLAIVYFPTSEIQRIINTDLRLLVTFFLMLYAVLLTLGRRMKCRSWAASVIAALSISELVLFGTKAVSDRPTVTKQELSERSGYDDQTVDAIAEIKAADHGFFRVTKTWSSGPSDYQSLNDAMVFNYYGTASYSSFNPRNYISFLQALDAQHGTDIARFALWSTGLLGQPLLSTFACEKFVLTEDPVRFQTAEEYELVKHYGSTYLFRNKLFLPLGLTFDRYISESLFLQLPIWARKEALLHVVVLADTSTGKMTSSVLTLDQLKERLRDYSLQDILSERQGKAMSIATFTNTRITGTVQLQQRGIALFQMPFDQGWQVQVDGLPAERCRADVGLFAVFVEAGQHTLALSYRPPFLITGAIIMTLSAVALILSIRLRPRVDVPQP